MNPTEIAYAALLFLPFVRKLVASYVTDDAKPLVEEGMQAAMDWIEAHGEPANKKARRRLQWAVKQRVIGRAHVLARAGRIPGAVPPSGRQRVAPLRRRAA